MDPMQAAQRMATEPSAAGPVRQRAHQTWIIVFVALALPLIALLIGLVGCSAAGPTPATSGTAAAGSLPPPCPGDDPLQCLVQAERAQREGLSDRAFVYAAAAHIRGTETGKWTVARDADNKMRDLVAAGIRNQTDLEAEMAQACDRRNLESCVALGSLLLYEGTRMPRAFGLCQAACEGGSVVGCGMTGQLYLEGIGVQKNVTLARAHLHRACSGGEMHSCFTLGHMYHTGDGAGQDHVEAVKLHGRACERGLMEGCFGLSLMYMAGDGVAQSAGKAVELIQRSCDGGLATACYVLGDWYAKGIGVEQDLGAAATHFGTACDGGEAMGCLNRALMLLTGAGTAPDPDEARVLFERVCDMEHGAGCFGLALMHLADPEATEAQHRQATGLLDRSCKHGIPMGCTVLGQMYIDGNSVDQDYGKAANLFRQACADGETRGCLGLAVMYLKGKGIERDPVQANRLFQKACDSGAEMACNVLRMQEQNSL